MKNNERYVSLEALNEVTEKNAYNNIALKNVLDKNNDLERTQKAFVTELVNGTLRNIIRIDNLINNVSNTKTEKMNYNIRNILRLSVYQILYMNVPPHAICNEAVNIVKSKKMTGLSGFVNGVLRNIIRNKSRFTELDENEIGYLQNKYSYPDWIVNLLLEQYDKEFTEKLLQKMNTAPTVSVCVNTVKTNAQELTRRLKDEGIQVLATIADNCLKITKTSNLANTNAFKEGLFHIQDLSGILAINVLDPRPGEYIIDVCAAPGGKTACIAEAMNNSGCVLARDVFAHKLDLISETARRLGLTNIKLQNFDAAVTDESKINKADRVLIDAPCSGFGLFQKKPDIKYKKKPEDIEQLAQIQKNILAACSQYVKPNGVLVYSTCTFTKYENINNIKWFEENFDFVPESIEQYLPAQIQGETKKDGYIQLFPHVHDSDGFFIARFKRSVFDAPTGGK